MIPTIHDSYPILALWIMTLITTKPISVFRIYMPCLKSLISMWHTYFYQFFCLTLTAAFCLNTLYMYVCIYYLTSMYPIALVFVKVTFFVYSYAHLTIFTKPKILHNNKILTVNRSIAQNHDNTKFLLALKKPHPSKK